MHTCLLRATDTTRSKSAALLVEVSLTRLSSAKFDHTGSTGPEGLKLGVWPRAGEDEFKIRDAFAWYWRAQSTDVLRKFPVQYLDLDTN
jgi:hypothetical protein